MSTSVQLKRFDNLESNPELASQSDVRISGKKPGCSSMEKLLLFMVALAMAVAVAACIALAVLIIKQDTTKKVASHPTISAGQIEKTTTVVPPVPIDNTVCNTPHCVLAAARVYQSMDPTVHPCDNFYRYACGNWMKTNPIPDNSESVTIGSKVSDKVNLILRGKLESRSTEGESEAVTKAKTLYNSCINAVDGQDDSSDPVQAIYNMYGHWPLMHSDWKESNFDLVDTLVAMWQYGRQRLIQLSIHPDDKNGTVQRFLVDQPGLMLGILEYYTNETVPKFANSLIDLAEEMGAENISLVEADVEEFLKFELQVAKLIVPRDQRRDIRKRYNLMTIADMYANISNNLDWLRFFRGIMSTNEVNIQITNEEQILVYARGYLKDVLELLDRTPKRVVANYLMTSEIMRLSEALPRNVAAVTEAYRKVMQGTKAQQGTWKSCVRDVSAVLGDVVDRLFVDSAFDEEIKDVIMDMTTNVKSAFNDRLAHVDWMDEATRKIVKEKAGAIQPLIGFSPNIKNDTYLNEKYKELYFNSTTFFENILNASKFSSRAQLMKLRQPVDRLGSIIEASIVNAYYKWTSNIISIGAAMLQPPYFSKDYPKSMNYGGIGMVIGHEITHGFDDIGIRYNQNGNLKEWWNQPIIERYEAKVRCMIEQYSNFTVRVAGRKLDGFNTQGENIADNGGLAQAFTAYRAWVEKQGKEEQKLPGLELTPNQLFFLNFAQIWCINMTPSNALNSILTANHSPGRFRILGSLQNSKEFAEAFNCPISYMNPRKKCSVW